MKKHNIYMLIACALLIIARPSYAMHGALFTAARVLGVTTAPVVGSCMAYNTYKDGQKKVMELEPVTNNVITDWFDEEKKKLHISDVKLLKGKSWSSYSFGKTDYIVVPSDDIIKLNKALINKSMNNEITDDQDNAEIARGTIALKHELSHIINKDSQYHTYAFVAIPLVVEALSFGATSVVRKLCNIQAPNTCIKTMLRSSVAIGAIVPKALLSPISLILYSRYQETRADKFACEHAESRLELEEYAQHHKNNESPYATGSRNDIRWAAFDKDPLHPAPIDRKEMVEAYIAQWDAANKGC